MTKTCQPDGDYEYIQSQEEQDQIHGYPSCMQVGRASDKKGLPCIWAEAVMQ